MASPEGGRRRSRRDGMLELGAPARAEAMEAYLRERLGIWLDASPEALDAFVPSSLVEPLGKDWAFLSHMLLKDFKLRLYPSELKDLRGIGDLASYLAAELDPPPLEPGSSERGDAEWPWDPPGTAPVKPLSGAAFLFSTPRSGSTLLQAMLAGSPQLFAPPELWLLPFDSLRSRQCQLERVGRAYLGSGLQQAVSILWTCDLEEAHALVREWIGRDMTTSEVYEAFLTKASPRLLVDKTPVYSASLDWLRQAERLFHGARYVFLVRHPYSVIESILRMRFHRMIGRSLGLWCDDAYSHVAWTWEAWNRNIAAFLGGIEPERRLFVRYEDLVAEPERTMTGLAAFLGVPFHPSMLDPYGEDRVTFEESRQATATGGDPGFARRGRLDPSLARWRHFRMPQRVRDIVGGLAGELGYETPGS